MHQGYFGEQAQGRDLPHISFNPLQVKGIYRNFPRVEKQKHSIPDIGTTRGIRMVFQEPTATLQSVETVTGEEAAATALHIARVSTSTELAGWGISPALYKNLAQRVHPTTAEKHISRSGFWDVLAVKDMVRSGSRMLAASARSFRRLFEAD